MSLFTKIRESRQARKQRRLAAKLHKMIEAAAAENDGTFALQYDMILQGDLFARGDIGARHDLHIGGGIHTDGDLDAKKITATKNWGPPISTPRKPSAQPAISEPKARYLPPRVSALAATASAAARSPSEATPASTASSRLTKISSPAAILSHSANPRGRREAKSRLRNHIMLRL